LEGQRRSAPTEASAVAGERRVGPVLGESGGNSAKCVGELSDVLETIAGRDGQGSSKELLEFRAQVKFVDGEPG
jgi:hypothetical protein